LASWSVVDTALTCTLVLGDYLWPVSPAARAWRMTCAAGI